MTTDFNLDRNIHLHLQFIYFHFFLSFQHSFDTFDKLLQFFIIQDQILK